ncbi:MAG TPA: hypothetical protein VEX64_07655, partial [Pyrinomonadaceae bacterium]|nr:hypothetical protein [Pyrinomonadaceae bacterium]
MFRVQSNAAPISQNPDYVALPEPLGAEKAKVTKKSSSLPVLPLLAIGLSCAVAALAFIAWQLNLFVGLNACLYFISIPEAMSLAQPPAWMAGAVLLAVAVCIGILTERIGAYRIAPFVGGL